MYENMIISYGMWCYRQVLLVDNSLVLNHIISRRITVLKYKTFGTQRYAIVNQILMNLMKLTIKLQFRTMIIVTTIYSFPPIMTEMLELFIVAVIIT